jgi:hypothetical protein
MLRKLEFLPREHLIQKFSDVTGMSYEAAGRLADREGIEVITDYIEAYLSMPPRRFHNRRPYVHKF